MSTLSLIASLSSKLLLGSWWVPSSLSPRRSASLLSPSLLVFEVGGCDRRVGARSDASPVLARSVAVHRDRLKQYRLSCFFSMDMFLDCRPAHTSRVASYTIGCGTAATCLVARARRGDDLSCRGILLFSQVTKGGIKLNTKKIYRADGHSVKEVRAGDPTRPDPCAHAVPVLMVRAVVLTVCVTSPRAYLSFHCSC